jgi:hypothetical protein
MAPAEEMGLHVKPFQFASIPGVVNPASINVAPGSAIMGSEIR